MTIIAPRMSRVKRSPSQLASAKSRELRAQGVDILMLTAGEPDLPTPDHVIEAAFAAARRGETRYTNTEGTPELKRAIQAKFRRENRLDYGLDEIIASNGAKQVIFNAFMATLASGDEVIVPAPYWASYIDLASLAEGQPVPLACPQNNGFKLRPEDLDAAITPRTKWLILNSPSNPCGAVYTPAELEAIAEVLRRHPHVWVLADEIYEHLVFGEHRVESLAAVASDLKARTLTVNGVSKTYAMTGWRLGYAGGPAELIKAMIIVQGQATSSPSAIGQAAALAALTGPQDLVPERKRIFEERRNLIVRLLNEAPGLSCHAPDGAMYVYCSCAGLLGKRTPAGKVLAGDEDVAVYLLEAANVAVVHGAAYGLSPYIRASFAASLETLRDAGGRIVEACRALG
jgi:aspartate aminotransferase